MCLRLRVEHIEKVQSLRFVKIQTCKVSVLREKDSHAARRDTGAFIRPALPCVNEFFVPSQRLLTSPERVSPKDHNRGSKEFCKGLLKEGAICPPTWVPSPYTDRFPKKKLMMRVRARYANLLAFVSSKPKRFLFATQQIDHGYGHDAYSDDVSDKV